MLCQLVVCLHQRRRPTTNHGELQFGLILLDKLIGRPIGVHRKMQQTSVNDRASNGIERMHQIFILCLH